MHHPSQVMTDPRSIFAVAFGTTAVGAAVFVLAAFYPG
jgi:hypothetical protein